MDEGESSHSIVRRSVMALLRSLFVVFVLILASAELQAQTCEICHYWSVDACTDACARSFPDLGGNWAACFTCCEQSCGGGGEPDDGHGVDNQCGSEGCSDPLLIDFGRHGLELTDAANGVWFDIDGDGTVNAIAWTTGAAEDAFLALDVDRNGRIDGAKELFGDATPQSRTDSPNGFRALAEWDRRALGGNEDGTIGPADAIWPRLLLWVDRSHDGISQTDELKPVSASPLTGILLDYRESRRRDQHGNRYTYRSVAVIEQGRQTDVIDVFFATLP
jgi:hypothetical protein